MKEKDKKLTLPPFSLSYFYNNWHLRNYKKKQKEIVCMFPFLVNSSLNHDEQNTKVMSQFTSVHPLLVNQQP